VNPQRNLVLLGFMGTGKTTVGRLLAQRLGRPFVDVDEWIEAKTGRGIPELFAQRGEAAFRQLEAEAVAYLAEPTGKVLAGGGGIVKSAENVRRLAAGGELVCLTAQPETILARVGHQRHRPLLAGEDPGARIRALLAEREALYRAIPRAVATDGLSPEAVAEAVLRLLDEPAVPPGG
jgi:shikimate kinase